MPSVCKDVGKVESGNPGFAELVGSKAEGLGFIRSVILDEDLMNPVYSSMPSIAARGNATDLDCASLLSM